MSSGQNKVYLISNGDLRDSACQLAWPKQEETLKLCQAASRNWMCKLRS